MPADVSPPPHRTPREFHTAKRQSLEASAIVMDLEDRLERLRAILRYLTATLHDRHVRAARRWYGNT